jgi:murein DD-endopeptidase MepM/ murein hydrolase activator NlpD
MQFSILQKNARNAARGAAILLAGGLATGCSSNAVRFDDGFFTGSTANQRQIIRPADQPFPADADVASAEVDSGATGAVYSAAPSASPVTRTALAPVADPAMQTSDPAPVRQAALEPAPAPRKQIRDNAAPKVGERFQKGWSSEGGTQVTLREGDTVNSLARRYGVPAKAILAANGLSEGASVRAGQSIIIPTYSNGGSRVAAKAQTPPADKAPAPAQEKAVAVLPQNPKLRDGKANGQALEASAATAHDTGAYTVASGDSLYAIAKKTGTRVEDLKAANGLSDGRLKIGQKLTIPDQPGAPAAKQVAAAKPAAATVAAAEPVAAAPVRKAEPVKPQQTAGYTPPSRDGKAIREAEEASSEEAPGGTGIGRMRWPVRGRVISNFGGAGGKANDGIDIAVPEGTPVKSAENGVVIYAGEGLKDFGQTVLVRHENGLVTVYGHASELKVARGDTVKRGQEIARSGMSGKTDTPKLHFEVRKNSDPVDPTTFLE